MIAAKKLSFGYAKEAPLFENFSVSIGKGETWSVIGPSGCGKTSLLYLLAGLRFPLSGTIVVDGSSLLRPRPGTGLVLQDHGLLPWATVGRNVELGFAIRKFYGADGRHAPAGRATAPEAAGKKVSYWLERLGIAEVRNSYPAALSGGQRQRTAIARTMVLEPDLLLLDEPFSALDAPTRDDLQNRMNDLQRESGHTRIMVTHDIDAAVTMGEKILILQKGCNRQPDIMDNDMAVLSRERSGEKFRSICLTLHSKLGKRL